MIDIKAKEVFRLYLKQFSPLSEQEFEDIFIYFKELKLKKNEYFIKEGQICKNVGFIVKGILRVYYINDKGDDITSCFCPVNSLTTSYKSLITKTFSTLNIQALNSVELLIISHDDFNKILISSPAWQHVMRIILQNEYFNMEKYVSVLSNETAIEKYKRLLEEQPQIIQIAPIQHIASYLGVTRRTLTRIRGDVAKKNSNI